MDSTFNPKPLPQRNPSAQPARPAVPKPAYRDPSPPSKTVGKKALQRIAKKILENNQKMENPGTMFRGFFMGGQIVLTKSRSQTSSTEPAPAGGAGQPQPASSRKAKAGTHKPLA